MARKVPTVTSLLRISATGEKNLSFCIERFLHSNLEKPGFVPRYGNNSERSSMNGLPFVIIVAFIVAQCNVGIIFHFCMPQMSKYVCIYGKINLFNLHRPLKVSPCFIMEKVLVKIVLLLV